MDTLWEFVGSWAFLIYASLVGGGGGSLEVVSMFEAEAYFKVRGIAVSAEQLEAVASKDPSDGKKQIAQLLAIDWLGDHPKEGKTARATLQQIGDGKKAQDPQGFAKDHALRALARIDAKTIPAGPRLPLGSVREDAYSVFPGDANLLGSLDLRASGSMKIEDKLLPAFFKAAPEKGKKELIEFVEELGNIRIDRVSFALQFDAKSPPPEEWYLRVNGAGLRSLATYVTKQFKNAKTEERKGPSGDKTTIVMGDAEPVAYAFINDTEVLIAGRKNEGRGLATLEKALAVRAGDKPGALKGPVGKLLKQVPEQAYFAVAGELSDEIREKLSMEIKAAPMNFLLFAHRDKETTLTAIGTMKEAGDGKLLAEQIELGRTKAFDFLKAPPPEVKLSAENAAIFRKVIENFKIESKDRDITGSGKLSAEAIKALVNLIAQSIPSDR
jgi:hypothetical protein